MTTTIVVHGVLTRAHDSDSGWDIATAEPVSLSPDCPVVTVATGVRLELPEGIEAQVRPRSGLAAAHGIVAAWGTVAPGYRGEVRVTLLRVAPSSASAVTIPAGARVAQIVFSRLLPVEVVQAVDLVLDLDTDRGERGHGSTGL